MKQKIIHCEEVAVDPVIVTLGDIQVDVARISAYNSIRMLRLIQEVREESKDLTAEATEIVLDIIKEQNHDYTEEALLKAGNQAQLNVFVQTVVGYTLKTYAPLTRRDNPLTRTPATAMKQAEK